MFFVSGVIVVYESVGSLAYILTFLVSLQREICRYIGNEKSCFVIGKQHGT
jgi:hypothetical protein